MNRGKDPIVAAFFETQRAANRNGHKKHWCEVPLSRLIFKLGEELLELGWALLRRQPRASGQALAELGDVIWCLVMIADRCQVLEVPRDK